MIFGITANGQTISIETVDNASEAGPVNGRFRVSASSLIAHGSISVQYSVGSNAIEGEDYEFLPLSKTLTLPGGLFYSEGFIDVNIIQDILIEGNETVEIILIGTTDGIIGPNSTATVTIQDNDASVAFSVASSSGLEDTGDNLPTLIVNGGVVDTNSSVTINIDPSSTASGSGEDYSLPITVDIPVGTYNNESFPLGLTITPDTIVEEDETIILELVASTGDVVEIGAQSTTTYTILNDDDDEMSIVGDIVLAEGNAGSTTFNFQVTRTGDLSEPATVNYSVAGSGTDSADGTDFVGGSFPNGTASFLPSEDTATISIEINGDLTVEPNETFTVTLSDPSEGYFLGIADAIGTIENDDSDDISIGENISLAEGNMGTTAFDFSATRTGDSSLSASATFTVTPSGADPANTTDFVGNTFPTGTVNFIAGSDTATFTVNVNGDVDVEPDESFMVTLSAPGPGYIIGAATAIGTILNDDTYTATITAITPNASEDPLVQGVFTVELDAINTTGSLIVVNYTVGGGTATSGSDFVALSGSVSIPNNQQSANITLTPINDNLVEADETVILTLATGTGYTVGTPPAATVNIISEDRANISIDDVAVNENAGTATFTVTLSGDTPTNFNVSYTTVNGTAIAGSDFTSTSGIIPFLGNDGETHNIVVNILDDGQPENNETFFVNLSVSNGFVSLSDGQGTGTIIDNDNCVAEPIRNPNVSTTFCEDDFSQDLNEYVLASDIPSGFVLIWSGSPDFTVTGSRLDNTVVTRAATYYGFLYNEETDCSSRPLAVNLAQNVPPTIVTTTPVTICGPGDATISAVGSASGGTLSWYDSESATVPLRQGSSFFIPGITVTTTYYVEILANGCTSEREPVTVTVTAPLEIGTTIDTAVCNDNGGNGYILDLDSTRVNGTIGGTWSLVGTPPESISIGADNVVDFEGASVGDYIFRFTADTSESPCIVDDMEASVDVTITLGACGIDLGLEKTVDNANVSEGNQVIFTITLTNNSPITVSNVRINELIDPNIGFQYISHSVSEGTYDVIRGVWELDEVLGDEVNILTITASVVREGTFQNVVSLVGSFPEDENPANNTARVAVTVGPRSNDECGFMFNQISPNGDGTNDTLYINCIEQYPDNAIQIYDRYGNEVFTARRYDNSWMGTGKNGALPKGTYFYILDLGDGTGVKKGWIQIIRQ